MGNFNDPYLAITTAALLQLPVLDGIIDNLKRSEKTKKLLHILLQHTRENTALNALQSALLNDNAKNGWLFMGWCSALDAVSHTRKGQQLTEKLYLSTHAENSVNYHATLML